MKHGLGPVPVGDPLSAREMVAALSEHLDADVTVDIAGTLADVHRVIHDPDRERIVLCLHPDDVDEALRRLFRRASTVDRIAERSGVFPQAAKAEESDESAS